MTQLDGGLTFGRVEDLLADWPAAATGRVPAGQSHSPAGLLWHLAFCQTDILDYLTRDDYAEPDWPADYWPTDAADFGACRRDFLGGLGRAKRLVADADLLAAVPTHAEHTVLRGVLMIVEHNAYHLGQLATLRALVA